MSDRPPIWTSVLGTETYDHWQDDDLILETRQRVDHILDHNQEQYNADHPRWGDGRPIARIPIAMFLDLIKQGIVEPNGSMDGERFRKFLNDSDFRKLRIRPGKI